MVDGLNFKDFVAFLSAFSAKANMTHKIERKSAKSSAVCLYILVNQHSDLSIVKIDRLYYIFQLSLKYMILIPMGRCLLKT